MIFFIIQYVSLIILAIGLFMKGFTVRDPAYWLIMIGLIFYVKFGGANND